MRGRLISPFDAELAQLDTTATSTDPDGAGPLTSGYDPDFMETVSYTSGGGQRLDGRREHALIRIPCQIEVGTFEALTMMEGGDSPSSQIILVFHFRDLERLDFVDLATGEAKIRKNDRLNAIYAKCGGPLIQTIRNPPGLYVTQAAPTSFGLGTHRNLLLVTFDSREQGTRGPA